MAKRRRFRHKTIAVIYDFDGTLTPQPMQEYTVLPKLGVAPDVFWRRVKQEVANTGGDEMLTYMRLLIKTLDEKEEHLSRSDFRGLGRNIQYFPGVETWFERITAYVAEHGKGYTTRVP